MPKHTLPSGWPDPYTLLRDPNWEENYPKLLLRGIYDIMERNRRDEEKKPALHRKRREEARAHTRGIGKTMPGDVERRYLAGFNIALFKLVNAKEPRFFPGEIKKGILTLETLNSEGKKREAEVLGLRELSPQSRRKYGKGTKRSDLKASTMKKMKELRRLITAVRMTTVEEGMPPAISPIGRSPE